jgi:uncharacterized protein
MPMMATDALIDASFLVAMGYPRDKHHRQAQQFVAQTQTRLIIPDVVIPEAFYNLRRLGGIVAALRFGELLSLQSPMLEPLMGADFQRAIAVMQTYQDADLDMVDCCIVAIAERLKISAICTFDRRDFSLLLPRHVDYFDLLP